MSKLDETPMNTRNRIDLHSLTEQASKSAEHEAFQTLVTTQHYRIGIGATAGSNGNYKFFIEALISLCKGLNSVDLSFIQKQLLLLRQLKERGYSLSCNEDGCISCELTINQENAVNECEALGKITENCLLKEEVIQP